MGMKLPPLVLQKVLADSPKLDRVTLPLPPSTNNLFVNARGRGRVKSKEYAAWAARVVPMLWELKPPERLPCTFFWLLTGQVSVLRDGDNTLKPLLDACVKAGVIKDDSLQYVRGWCGHAEVGPGDPCVHVWFEGVL